MQWDPVPLIILLSITVYVALAIWISSAVEKATHSLGVYFFVLILLLAIPVGILAGF